MRVNPLLAAALLVAGCSDALARNNPCGGIYASPGVGQVFGATLSGGTVSATARVDFDDGTPRSYSLDSNTPATAEQECSWNVSGLVDDSGATTTSYLVTCGSYTIELTLPDVRRLDEAATATLPAVVTPFQAKLECLDGSGTLTVEQASGAAVSGAPFVTSDFVRVVRIDYESAAADAGMSRCPSRASLHGRLTFTARSYSQAMSTGENHCPKLPDK